MRIWCADPSHIAYTEWPLTRMTCLAPAMTCLYWRPATSTLHSTRSMVPCSKQAVTGASRCMTVNALRSAEAPTSNVIQCTVFVCFCNPLRTPLDYLGSEVKIERQWKKQKQKSIAQKTRRGCLKFWTDGRIIQRLMHRQTCWPSERRVLLLTGQVFMTCCTLACKWSIYR